MHEGNTRDKLNGEQGRLPYPRTHYKEQHKSYEYQQFHQVKLSQEEYQWLNQPGWGTSHCNHKCWRWPIWLKGFWEDKRFEEAFWVLVGSEGRWSEMKENAVKND